MLSKIKDRLHAERFHYTNGMATDFSVPTPKPENSGMLSGMLGENNGQLRIEYSNYLTRKRWNKGIFRHTDTESLWTDPLKVNFSSFSLKDVL